MRKLHTLSSQALPHSQSAAQKPKSNYRVFWVYENSSSLPFPPSYENA